MANRPYLIVEKNLIEDMHYPIIGRLTIGRSTENVICIPDPVVSRKHAVIYPENDRVYIEDVGSTNGTFLNGNRIKSAVLVENDYIQVGRESLIRYMVEELPPDSLLFDETGEFVAPDFADTDSPQSDSPRMLEAISAMPLFASLNPSEIRQVCRVSKIEVVDAGKRIIRQGERSRSLYIILDGEVRVYNISLMGKEISLSSLIENQFFGEMSFLTGKPRTATVEAVENTMLCKIEYDAMMMIVRQWPQIKEVLKHYYLERLIQTRLRHRDEGEASPDEEVDEY